MDTFAFGENWNRFSKNVKFQKFLDAKASLLDLMSDLHGKTFLDVGCGSGLFSIAAATLGAKKILAFDADPQCIATSQNLLEKVCQWDSSIKSDKIEFKTASILDESLDVGRWDIVYSWGVLHHTGNMYKAFEVVSKLVADNGMLVIAIYNKHFTSRFWKIIKYTYVKSPKFIRKLMVFLTLLVKLPAVFIISRQNPFKKMRGMQYYADIVDWVGGYPYEYASPDEITGFFEQRGFTLKKFIKTSGFTGCNQFVFEKVV
jgi:2-polyprenyl-3-methyl-5-hydroxy-6-metoxy-1,4-benzoquinol methylase